MKTFAFIILNIFLLAVETSTACDCDYLGGFALCNQLSDIVVYGKVIKYDNIGSYRHINRPYSIQFEIIEKIRGIESRDTIIIFGDNGNECRPYIETFEPNSEWILALDIYSKDYEISSCGEFFLPVINGKVAGRIFGRGRTSEIKNYEISFIINEVINKPQDYSLYKGMKRIRKDGDGKDYLTFCDQLPKCSLTPLAISGLVNKNQQLLASFMNHGDSYLIHAQIIISSKGEYKFKGLSETGFKPFIWMESIESRVAATLKNLNNWENGFDNGKAVSALILIPIILKRE